MTSGTTSWPDETDGYSFGDTEDGDNLGLRVDDDETHDIGTFVASKVASNVSTLSETDCDAWSAGSGNIRLRMTTTYAADGGISTPHRPGLPLTAASSAAMVTDRRLGEKRGDGDR